MDSTQFMSLTEDSVPYVQKPADSKISRRNIGGSLWDQKNWRLVSVELLAGVLATVTVWGYLYLYPDRNSSNPTPRVFTFSPAKGVDAPESERKIVRP